MKIGIFTDTYRPSVNGVVYVIEILRRCFEEEGHEVYIFAPAAGLNTKSDDDHIIRFPAVPGVIFEESNVSFFFPPTVLKQIKELEFDMFHFMVPGPVGLMAIYAAQKLGKPVVAEYTTDYFEYIDHYPVAALGILALGLALPFTFKVSRSELTGMLRAGRPRIGLGNWGQEVVKNLLTVVHSHCDAVIVHSRKSATQLKSWQTSDDNYPMDIIPTGVNPVKKPAPAELEAIKKQWGIEPTDEVVLNLGRMSSEKNLDLLIPMMEELIKWRPNAKLVFVGDFDYRETLEAHVKSSAAADRIIFVGKIPHEHVNRAYSLAKIFVFPSMSDTQSLTLHEAALAGLPIVMIDETVTEVVKDGINGFFSYPDDPIDMAAKVRTILENPALQKKMSAAGKKNAKKFSEETQAKKILKIYRKILSK